MGEPTCLMRSTPQTSDASRIFHEEDPVCCLGESISFGRHIREYEPLAWEKWSMFPRNRYKEEAEKSLKPGSVAKMKAYFEAYYKTNAANKWVAQYEEANESEFRAVAQDTCCSNSGMQEENHSVSHKSSQEEVCNLELGSSFTVTSCDPSAPSEEVKDCILEVDESTLSPENSTQLEVQHPNESEKQQSITSIPQMEPINLGDDHEKTNARIKKKLQDSDLGRSLCRKLSKLSTSSSKVATSVHQRKEECLAPRNRRVATDTLDMKRLASKSVQMRVNIGSHSDVTGKSSPNVHNSANGKPLTSSAKIIGNKTSIAGVSQHISASPQPDIGCNTKPSASSCGFKKRTFTTFCPFKFRTKEKAVKHREFFKNQQEEAQKIQQLEKNKKQENISRKLAQGIGKTKSAGDSNTKSSSGNIKEIPRTQPCSSKLGKKVASNPEPKRCTCLLPGPRIKSDRSKLKVGIINLHTASHSLHRPRRPNMRMLTQKSFEDQMESFGFMERMVTIRHLILFGSDKEKA